MAQDRRSYTQEEVNAILRRALEKQETSSDLSHGDLVETARDVGIEPAALERAIAEVDREREALALRAEWQLEKRTALRHALITWAWVSMLVFVVDFFTAGGPWFHWVLIPWGLMLGLRALRLRQGPTPAELARIEKRRHREERQRAFARKFERGAALLGNVVEEGASMLLQRLEEKRREQEERRLGGPRPPGKLPEH